MVFMHVHLSESLMLACLMLGVQWLGCTCMCQERAALDAYLEKLGGLLDSRACWGLLGLGVEQNADAGVHDARQAAADSHPQGRRSPLVLFRGRKQARHLHVGLPDRSRS